MLLAELVQVSQSVAGTSRRTEKVRLLADFLARLEPAEIPPATAFLSGQTLQRKSGLGYATLRNVSGDPAKESRLTILDVDRTLAEIAAAGGKGGSARRLELARDLYARATGPEQQLLTGLLTGELRQGALEGIMIDAVSAAARTESDRVRRAVMLAGEIPSVAYRLLTGGPESLAEWDVRLFRPVQPMLAQTADDVEDAIATLGEAALEYKFDGARVQVHKDGDEVRVFTRSLNEVSGAVPEVVQVVRAMPARQLILDGEVLSLAEDGRPQPFQVTMRRFGRRLNVEQLQAELPLTPVWFDLIYLDGESLLDEVQRRRFDSLREIAGPESLVPHLVTSDPERARAFAEQALNAGHEGVMAKSPDSKYAAGARGASWLKVKQARTLDLVILAAEWGNGRRQGWLSNLHLGARDTARGGYAMLGKTFKGLTDEMLAWQTQRLLDLEVARDRYVVHVRPELVAEIAFNEIQASSRYPSGLALRFARVKRYRPDKTADSADTFETVQSLAAAGGIMID
ncbi:MAG TPA: ATP-dependent DNA ligase [Bryobacteraceae bacterium]|nr:ATP-dependent DNA ligase [Bryobacteraceae bacterium]